MIDPAQQIYDAFYDFITGRFPGMKVLRRRANSPAPKGQYLVIDDLAGLLAYGTASQGHKSETDYQSKVLDFTADVAIWEIGAGCSTLVRLMSDLDLQDSVEFFVARGVSILKRGGVVPVPSLDDQNYREQFRLELSVAVSVGQSDESLGYIETVSFINNISH